MTPWWGEVVAYLILVALAVAYLTIPERRRRRASRRLAMKEQEARVLRCNLHARKREVAKTLDYIRETDPDAFKRAGTFDRLVDDVTTSDYGYRSETPTFDSLCADVARREAAELDVEWEREAGA